MIKLLIILSIAFIGCNEAAEKKQISFGVSYNPINIADYGAIPNDGLNDYAAFKKISDTINARGGNTVVNFNQQGQYDIRPPYLDTYPDSIQTNSQWDVFSLSNCTNVTFNSIGVVTIKLMNNVPFGVKSVGQHAHIGSLFRFTNCTYITVNGIIGDGNMDGMHLLGNYGVGRNPYELEHEGVFILNSGNVTVTNSTFKNFGRDGIMMLQETVGTRTKKNYFYNSKFNDNGRNGFSWLGGDSTNFKQCEFIGNAQGRISENPGSGLDIEPERNSLCTEGIFTTCKFSDNAGYSVVTGSLDEAYNFTFDGCEIYNFQNLSLYVASPYFYFRNTRFVGKMLLNFFEVNYANSPSFINCSFSDSLAGYINDRGSYMIAFGRYAKFSSCNFVSYGSMFCYSEGDSVVFDRPIFNALFTTPTNFGNNCFALSGTIFNNATFKNVPYPNYLNILTDTSRHITLNRCTFKNILPPYTPKSPTTIYRVTD